MMMVQATAQTPGVSAFAEPKYPSSVHLSPLYGSTSEDSKITASRMDGVSEFFSNSGHKDSSLESGRSKSAAVEMDTTLYSSPSLRVHFHTNRDTGRVAISVIDAETKEVVREIPSEHVQKVTEKLQANLGLLFDSNG